MAAWGLGRVKTADDFRLDLRNAVIWANERLRLDLGSDRCCHVWTTPFLQGLIWIDADRCGLRSCVRPVDAVLMTAGPDEVRVPGPITLSSFEALTIPRGVPVAVPLDHHQSHLPSQFGAAARGCRGSYHLKQSPARDMFPRAPVPPRQCVPSCWPLPL